MLNIEIIILLLSVITLLSVFADKIKIPYPILLVLIGLGIGFIPGLPFIELNPDIVFLIFLPPLLYGAAWTTSWHEFKAAKRPISLLAIGCVLFTTTAVAVVAHHLIPGFSWPIAFVLGAIISPPDAVAATSVTKGLGIPKRVITILEGESLVNDASGLIAYRYAVAAVATGHFVLWEASVQFLRVATVGIAIGLAIGYILTWVHKHIQYNPTVNTSLTLLTPYVAFLTAEAFHMSGVLAVVTAGLYLSWQSPEMFSHKTRIQAFAVWETVEFILNGIIFILIGLQLPIILKGISEHSFGSLVFYGAIISGIVMLVRMIWVFPGAYIPRWLSKEIRRREPTTNWKAVTIVGWAGMRGVVSLAAALALPVTIGNNVPFPQRDLILFLTFCVILATLVFQGFSLPYLIRWFKLKSDNNLDLEEIEARKRMAASAIVYIEENYSLNITETALAQIKSKYEIKINHLNNYSRIKDDKQIDLIFDDFQKTQLELLQIERKSLIQLRKEGIISDEVVRKLEHELDLEESRLVMEKTE
jgi:CPA1 family monovalent cation:H+ antiporter